MKRDHWYLLGTTLLVAGFLLTGGSGPSDEGSGPKYEKGRIHAPNVDDITVVINGVRQSKLDMNYKFSPGEAIVKFKEAGSFKSGVASLAGRFKSKSIGSTWIFSDMNVAVLRTDDHRAFKAGLVSEEEAKKATLTFIEQLRNDPLVLYAEPNYVRRPMQASRTPNDPHYSMGACQAWHYPLINLPQAWEYVANLGTDPNTIGSSEIVVAVIDDGIVRNREPAATPYLQRDWHEDLTDNILRKTNQWGQLVTDGYDFISDAGSAADGDDDDPAVQGDADDDPTFPNPGPTDSHGTHVSGTVSATTNNNLGVAGTAWNVKIMPLRVVGTDGSNPNFDADLVGAIRYASGFDTGTGQFPSRIANVVNMSLGEHPWNAAVEDAIREAYDDKWVVFCVAAGNEAYNDISGLGFTDYTNYAPGYRSFPGDYPKAITVGAVGWTKKRSYYSQFHPDHVDITAPGGNIAPVWYDASQYYPNPAAGLHIDAMYKDNGICSTIYIGDPLDCCPDGYMADPYQGTSMATPHVAGVIALMQSARVKLGLRTLTSTEIEWTLPYIVEDLADPGRDDEYGYGLIDAYKAVQQAVTPWWSTIQAGSGGGGGHSGGCFIDVAGDARGGLLSPFFGMAAVVLLCAWLASRRAQRRAAG